MGFMEENLNFPISYYYTKGHIISEGKQTFVVSKEALALSNPSFRNIPETTVISTARGPDTRTVRVNISGFDRAQTASFIAGKEKAIANLPSQARRTIRVRNKSRGRTVWTTRLEDRKSWSSRSGKIANTREKHQKDIRRGNQRIAEITRKEKISPLGTADIQQETFVARGASARALERAKRRGQTGVVTRTAARRGRQKKVIKTIKGSRCNARLDQDVSALTADEAVCELNEKSRFDERTASLIGGRRINQRVGGIKINEREARLIVKVEQGKRSTRRVGKGRRARNVTTFSGGGRGTKEVFGFTQGLFGQAKAGLGVLDFIKAPANNVTTTSRIGGRSTGEIVQTTRSKFRGSELNIMRSRANFLFSGGANNEFDAILSGDIANRQSGRGATRAVSGGTVRLNKSVVDPFFSGSINRSFLQTKTTSKSQAAARSSARGRTRQRR